MRSDRKKKKEKLQIQRKRSVERDLEVLKSCPGLIRILWKTEGLQKTRSVSRGTETKGVL